jgi:surface protein
MFSGADTSTTVTDGLNLNDATIYFNNGGPNDQSNGIPGSLPLWSTRSPGTGTGTAAIDMSFMFSGAIFFNQDINSWNTSYVTSMTQMFENAQGFNNGDRKYSSNNAGSHNMTWSTSRVTSFLGMFYNNYAFNQNVNSWDVSGANTFRYMFATNRANNTSGACNCEFFNNGNSRIATTSNTMTWLASGSTAITVDMGLMFWNNPYFNQDVTSWDVSKVTDFGSTFKDAIAFNNGEGSGAVSTKPLSWNTAAATNMSYMFAGATSFNQNLLGWNTSAVTTMRNMFDGANKFNNGQAAGTSGGADITFSTGNVTNMTYMFNRASVFNQNVSGFDTSNVTDMSYMFAGTLAFNNGQAPGGAGSRPLTWTTSNVTTIAFMFNATSGSVFNQSVSGWDLSKCTS